MRKLFIVFAFASVLAGQANAENCVFGVGRRALTTVAESEWAAVGKNNQFFSSGVTWYETVAGPTRKPVVYFNLAVQYTYATLNFQHGAIPPVEVVAAYNTATAFFTFFDPTYNFKGDPAVTQDFEDVTDVLKRFNTGRFGVDRCN